MRRINNFKSKSNNKEMTYKCLNLNIISKKIRNEIWEGESASFMCQIPIEARHATKMTFHIFQAVMNVSWTKINTIYGNYINVLFTRFDTKCRMRSAHLQFNFWHACKRTSVIYHKTTKWIRFV